MSVEETQLSQKITFHVGAPKTGTTSIQQFLFDNSIALKEQGVFYPTGADDPIFENFRYHYAIVEALTGRAGHLFKMDRQDVQTAVLNSITKALRDPNVRHIILSHEILYTECSNLDSEYLRKLVGEAEVRFLIYARRLDELLESLYRQFIWGRIQPSGAVHHGRLIPLIESTHHVRNLEKTTVSAVADCFQQAVPGSEIVVRPYSVSRQGNVVADFLDTIGVEASQVVTNAESAKRLNDSRPEPLIFLLWQLQRNRFPEAKCWKIAQGAISLARKSEPLPTFPGRTFRFLPVEIAQHAFDLYLQDVRRFPALAPDFNISFEASGEVEKKLNQDDIEIVLGWLAQGLPDSLIKEARQALQS
jgi:hypothetical protein